MPSRSPDRPRGLWPFESYRANALLVTMLSFTIPLVTLTWLFDWQIPSWFELLILAQGLGLVCAGLLVIRLLRPVDRTASALDHCVQGKPVTLGSVIEHPKPRRLIDGAMLLIQQHTEQRQLLETAGAEDHQTGLYNRRWTEERLAEDLSRARRGDANLTIALLRIADFGRATGETGPLARRLGLQNLTKVVRGNTRVGDWAGHWDHDQLVLVLWEDHDKAAAILERIETAVAATRVVPTRGKALTPRLRVAASKYNRRDTPKGLLNKLSDSLDHGEPASGIQLIDTMQSEDREPKAAAASA